MSMQFDSATRPVMTATTLLLLLCALVAPTAGAGNTEQTLQTRTTSNGLHEVTIES